MANELSRAFDTVANTRQWETVGAVFAGFLAPSIVRNVTEGTLPWDLPDEAYGIAVMAGSQYLPMYRRPVAIGGGLYTADKAAERFGLKATVQEVGN